MWRPSCDLLVKQFRQYSFKQSKDYDLKKIAYNYQQI